MVPPFFPSKLSEATGNKNLHLLWAPITAPKITPCCETEGRLIRQDSAFLTSKWLLQILRPHFTYYFTPRHLSIPLQDEDYIRIGKKEVPTDIRTFRTSAPPSTPWILSKNSHSESVVTFWRSPNNLTLVIGHFCRAIAARSSTVTASPPSHSEL